MGGTTSNRRTTYRFHPSRIVAVTFAVGGLCSSAFAISAAGASTKHTTKSVVISTVKNKKLGTLLVSAGKTLYTLKPSKTACTNACQKIWPEVVLPKGVRKATAGAGVSSAKLGIVMRSGGVRQVTYNGKALYWFALDKAAGQVKGNVADMWGKWTDVATANTTASGSGGGPAPTTPAPSPGGSGTAF